MDLTTLKIYDELKFFEDFVSNIRFILITSIVSLSTGFYKKIITFLRSKVIVFPIALSHLALLLLQSSKTNCTLCDGSSNAEKSFFIKILSVGMKVGSFNMMNMNSEFCFDNLIKKDICVDEKILLDIKNANYFKQLFKKSQFLRIGVKHAEKVRINPIIFLVCGNLPIWTYVSTAKEAIINRCLHIHYTTPANLDVTFNLNNFDDSMKSVKHDIFQ